MFENVKKILDISEEVGTPAMEVSVFHNGKQVFYEKRGVRDEVGTPLSDSELYNIYSCSKFITCSAALKLLERGKFRLEDDLADYIPAFANIKVKKNGGTFKADNRIKVSQLFDMTAGLNYYCESPEIKRGILETEGKCPTVKMMDYIAEMPLEFEPGEKWCYSLCHDVVAALVEVVSGVRFGEFVKSEIFDKLGMTDCTYGFPKDKIERICAQYQYDAEKKKYINIGKETVRYRLGSEYESGGAGCVCSVSDYMKFLEGMRCGKVLKPETIELMKTNRLNEEQQKCFWGASEYGYGLGVRAPLPSKKRTDYGWGGAAGAFAAVDDINGITIYYSQHVLSSPLGPVRKDFIEAAKLDLGYEAFVEDMYNGEGKSLA